jgi:hypothetical protein
MGLDRYFHAMTWLVDNCLTSGDRDARNNKLNGTLDIGTSSINQLSLIDLRQNQISGFTNRPGVEKVGVM